MATAAAGTTAAASAAPNAAAPTRIVSFVPAVTEMLYAMGAGDRVAGVGSYDRFPAEVNKLPRVGGLLDPDVERLLALKPDLVIVYATQQDLRHQLDTAHIATFVYVHRGLADVMQTMRDLGVRLGSTERGRALAANLDSALARVRARVAGRPRPKTLLVFGRDPGTIRNVEASGGYGFLHDMLETAGGADALADIHRESVQMSTEMILARAPEAIVELRYGNPIGVQQIDTEHRAWNALPSVPAVRNRRVYVLVGDEFVVPGPRLAVAVEKLSRVLVPDAW